MQKYAGRFLRTSALALSLAGCFGGPEEYVTKECGVYEFDLIDGTRIYVTGNFILENDQIKFNPIGPIQVIQPNSEPYILDKGVRHNVSDLPENERPAIQFSSCKRQGLLK